MKTRKSRMMMGFEFFTGGLHTRPIALLALVLLHCFAEFNTHADLFEDAKEYLEDDLGDAAEAIREIFRPQDDDIIFVGGPPDEGSVPIIAKPNGRQCKRASSDFFFRPQQTYNGTLLNFSVTGTCRNGCVRYRWIIEKYNPALADNGDDPWEGFAVEETEISSINIDGFPNDGSLFRVKLLQRDYYWDVEGHSDWTQAKPTPCYFFNGRPANPPNIPTLVAPEIPQDGRVRFNWVDFIVQNPVHEINHPDLKYRVEVYRVINIDSKDPEPDTEWVANVDSIAATDRGAEPPVGKNASPYFLPNEDGVYLWRALATYEDDFSSSAKVATSEFRRLKVTGRPFEGDTFGANLGNDLDIASVGPGNYTAVAVAPTDSFLSNDYRGTTNVYALTDAGWKRVQQLRHLAAVDPAWVSAFEPSNFADIALDDERIVVGVNPKNGYTESGRGAAIVYHRNPSNGLYEMEAVLYSGDGGDFFGAGVDISGDRIAVGAPQNDGDTTGGDGNSTSGEEGAIFIYERSGANTWQLQRGDLVGNGGRANGVWREDLGADVVLSGGRLFASARIRNQDGFEGVGGFYEWRYSGGLWSREPTLLSPNWSNERYFTERFAVRKLDPFSPDTERTIFVSSNYDSSPERVYAFRRDEGAISSDWLAQELAIPDEAAGGPIQDADFGLGIAVSGNTLAVGASKDHPNESGSVYIYRRVGGDWVFRNRISEPNLQDGARFGIDLALDGPHLVVGASGADAAGAPASTVGRVYFYEVDVVPPVAAIVESVGPRTTNEGTVAFAVNFSEPVVNVDEDDFMLEISGPIDTNGAITSLDRMDVPGSDARDTRTWIYNVSGLSGNGLLSLSLRPDRNIMDVEDLFGNPVVGSAKSGVVLDKQAPAVSDAFVEPQTAAAGETVRIEFTASELMEEFPQIEVLGTPIDQDRIVYLENRIANGSKTTFAKQSGFTVSYAYEYTVQPSDPIGVAPISVKLVDDAGNETTQSISGLQVVSNVTQAPNVVGLTEAEAEAAIINANLVAGAITRRCDASAADGQVLEQNPAGGSEVSRGSSVALVISSGPCPEPPAAPTNVRASNGTHNDRIRITWNSVPGAESYEVWRNDRSNVGTATLLQNGITNTTYDDMDLDTKRSGAIGTGGFTGFSNILPGGAFLGLSLFVMGLWPLSTHRPQLARGRVVRACAVSMCLVVMSTFTGCPTSTPSDPDTFYYWVRASNEHGTSEFSDSDTGYADTTKSDVKDNADHDAGRG